MTVLRWLEFMLFAVGLALATWCAVIMIEAAYTQHMPVPPPVTVTQTLPGDEGASRSSEPSTAYSPAPAAGAWLARLEAPSVALSTTVLEGTDEGTLKRAAGHIEETPLPGQLGNIGIAGHRDTVFRPLREVKVGDALNLTTQDRVLHYRVDSTSIVGPTDVYVLDPTREPTLTLVTCYPFEFFGHAPRRFIVQARLVDEEVRTAGTGTSGASDPHER